MSHSRFNMKRHLKLAILCVLGMFAFVACADPYKAYAECISLKSKEIESSVSYKSSQTLRCDKPNLRLWPCTPVERTMWDVANNNVDYQYTLADAACRIETGYEG